MFEIIVILVLIYFINSYLAKRSERKYLESIEKIVDDKSRIFEGCNFVVDEIGELPSGKKVIYMEKNIIIPSWYKGSDGDENIVRLRCSVSDWIMSYSANSVAPLFSSHERKIIRHFGLPLLHPQVERSDLIDLEQSIVDLCSRYEHCFALYDEIQAVNPEKT